MTFELLPTVVASAAAVLDFRFRKIPNWLTVSAFGIGVLIHVVQNGADGLLVALGGAALGLVVLVPFYLLHAMGAGDVKLLAALGALVGAQALVSVILYTAVVGGVISVFVLVRRGTLQSFLGNVVTHPVGMRLSGAKAPYGVAIASGVYLSMLLPSVIG